MLFRSYEDVISDKVLELFDLAMEATQEEEIDFLLKLAVDHMDNHSDAQMYVQFIDQQPSDEELESETYFWDDFISWDSKNIFFKGWERWRKVEAQQRRRIICRFQNPRCKEKSAKISWKRRRFKVKGFFSDHQNSGAEFFSTKGE